VANLDLVIGVDTAVIHLAGALAKPVWMLSRFDACWRWLVGCAGATSLAAALSTLDLDLGLTFDDEEKRDDTRAARKVLAELERRATEGAQARAGEQTPPGPKALLLLDNVDHPDLLQAPQSDLLTGRPWLHVLATTRRDAEEFGGDPEQLTVLAIDELPDDDAVRLIESYQPGGRFANAAERDAARALVKLLGGFTLAVEVVAVYLGERAGRVTCAAVLARLQAAGLGELDAILRGARGGVRHGEKLLAPTLQPTLDLLSDEERLVLCYAALLPPDSIPLPWLRALAAEEYPALGHDADPGYDDPWLDLVNHLLGLRLLQTVDLAADGRTPRLLRLHRLVGEVVRRADQEIDRHQESLTSHVRERCKFLLEGWLEWGNRWEIGPLGATAQIMIDNDAWEFGSWLAYEVSNIYYLLGMYNTAKPLTQRALDSRELHIGSEHPDTLKSVNDLAELLRSTGDYAGAEPLLRRALEAQERVLGPEHPDTLTSVNNLALLLKSTGDYAGAEPLYRRALEAYERVLGPEHPATLTSVNNLALLLLSTGDYAGAEPLSRRALEARERVLGPEHPATLTSVNNLAILLQSTGDYAGAEPLYRQALEGSERVLGPEHPDTLLSVNNLAVLLYSTGDYAGAEPLYRRALEARERVLGPEHPDTLGSMQNLSALLDTRGKIQEARMLRERRIALMADKPGTTPLQLRTLALDCYRLGDYAQAEILLRRVLDQNYELPSTHCHLARVALLLDNLSAAREHADQAWSVRAVAPPYVVPRILWLQVAGALIGGDTIAVQQQLGRLKTAMSTDDAIMEWTMDPVLAHLQPKLSPDDHALLTALVAALSFPDKLTALEHFPAWREAVAIPLE